MNNEKEKAPLNKVEGAKSVNTIMNEKKTHENISQDEKLRRYYKTCYYIGYLMGIKTRFYKRNKKTF